MAQLNSVSSTNVFHKIPLMEHEFWEKIITNIQKGDFKATDMIVNGFSPQVSAVFNLDEGPSSKVEELLTETADSQRFAKAEKLISLLRKFNEGIESEFVVWENVCAFKMGKFKEPNSKKHLLCFLTLKLHALAADEKEDLLDLVLELIVHLQKRPSQSNDLSLRFQGLSV
ncbi:MAG: hypothetical protein KGJ02_05015 [Verrucomicrobiota bacterium]|nr:hypothetical protein [Verrucomicrobiota bacterium]